MIRSVDNTNLSYYATRDRPRDRRGAAADRLARDRAYGRLGVEVASTRSAAGRLRGAERTRVRLGSGRVHHLPAGVRPRSRRRCVAPPAAAVSDPRRAVLNGASCLLRGAASARSSRCPRPRPCRWARPPVADPRRRAGRPRAREPGVALLLVGAVPLALFFQRPNIATRIPAGAFATLPRVTGPIRLVA